MFKKSIIIIFVIALASGFFWSRNTIGLPPMGDGRGFSEVAVNILEHGQFYADTAEGIRVEYEPVYPLFLVGVFSVFGQRADAVRFIQIIIFALTAALVFILAKNLINRQLAFLSALITALFYPLAGYSGQVYREVLFSFLLILLVFCLFKAIQQKKKGWFAAGGIMSGLLILTNGIVYFLPLVIAFGFLIFYKKKILQKRIWTACLLFFLFLALTLSLWLIRSQYSDLESFDIREAGVLLSRAYLIDGLKGKYDDHFVGQTLGYFFAREMNPAVDTRELFDFPPPAVYARMNELLSGGMSQKETSEILQKEAIMTILKNPHYYFLSSSLYFFSFNNPLLPKLSTSEIFAAQNLFTGTHSETGNLTKAVIVLIIRGGWLLFFLLVIYGMIKAVSRWRDFGWLLLIVVSFNLAYSLLFAIPRYALPIYPLYIIFFVYGLGIFWQTKISKA